MTQPLESINKFQFIEKNKYNRIVADVDKEEFLFVSKSAGTLKERKQNFGKADVLRIYLFIACIYDRIYFN